jgi:hypothetical protein
MRPPAIPINSPWERNKCQNSVENDAATKPRHQSMPFTVSKGRLACQACNIHPAYIGLFVPYFLMRILTPDLGQRDF